MRVPKLMEIGGMMLEICPLCGLDELASEGEYDCTECFERQILEQRELSKIDDSRTVFLDFKILPIDFERGENDEIYIQNSIQP